MGRREKPLDPAQGAVARFAFELRGLRATRAGAPTYRAMAQPAGYSGPTLSAAAGERLPTLPVLLAYVSACGGDTSVWERRWRAALADEAGTPAPDDAEGPYPGLARFEPADRDRFHGRDDLIAELLRLVDRRRVSAVVGAWAARRTRRAARRSWGMLRPGRCPYDSSAEAFRRGWVRLIGSGLSVVGVSVRIMQLRYAFRLDPGPGQRVALARAFGCARVVYDGAVAARERARREGAAFPSAGALSRTLITEAKRGPGRRWLSEVSAVILQQALRDVERAYTDFFSSLKGSRQEHGGGAALQVEAGCPAIRLHRERPMEDQRGGAAASAEDRRGEGALVTHPALGAVQRDSDPGCGRPVLRLLRDRDRPRRRPGADARSRQPAQRGHRSGSHTLRGPLRWPCHRLPALLAPGGEEADEGAAGLSRKQKGSKNREKARLRVARAHAQVADARREFHHQLSTQLIRESQAVAVEDLAVKALARTRLGKSIQHRLGAVPRDAGVQGWPVRARLCEGRPVQAHQPGVLGLWSQGRARTPARAHLDVHALRHGSRDRDHNAAKNVQQAAGLAVTACRAQVSRNSFRHNAKKQEATESTPELVPPSGTAPGEEVQNLPASAGRASTELAAADTQGRLTLWDAGGQRRIAVLAAADSTVARPALTFSADGSLLAASRADGSVRVWETASPRLEGATLPTATGRSSRSDSPRAPRSCTSRHPICPCAQSS